MSMTLETLIDKARKRADMENTDFVTDDEITDYINAGYRELYNLLVSKYDSDYFVADPYTITGDGSADSFDLPTDFFKLLGVDMQSNGEWVALRPFSFADRNKYSLASFVGSSVLTRYRVRGNSLWLTPTPANGAAFRLWYVPRFTELEESDDVMTGVNGWEEYVITHAAIEMKDKEESDVTILLAKKSSIKAEIESISPNRDAGGPDVVTDTSQLGLWSDPYSSNDN